MLDRTLQCSKREPLETNSLYTKSIANVLPLPFCPYCDFQIPLSDAKFCPNCGKAIAPATMMSRTVVHPAMQLTGESPLPLNEEPGGRWLLHPGEQIAWEKDFKEGLIHRHVEKAYVITNQRVVAIDIVNRAVIVSLPLRDTELVVMDRHSSSSSTGVGSYRGGMGTSFRTGTSRSIGSLVFIENGVERIRLIGLGDPDGVKNLFTSLKRSAP